MRQRQPKGARHIASRVRNIFVLGRLEIWILAAIFTIGGLVLVFGHIAEEAFEGDSAKFDETILLFFRSANESHDLIGAP